MNVVPTFCNVLSLIILTTMQLVQGSSPKIAARHYNHHETNLEIYT